MLGNVRFILTLWFYPFSRQSTHIKHHFSFFCLPIFLPVLKSVSAPEKRSREIGRVATAKCYNKGEAIKRKRYPALSILIELPTDVEDRLRAAAAAKGIAPQEFAVAVVTDAVLHAIAPAAAPTEDFGDSDDDGDDDDYEPTPADKARAEAFIALGEKYKQQSLPDIALEALRRRNMYDEPQR